MKIRELKYLAILKIEFKYPIWLLCELASVSRSAFYKYKRSAKSNICEVKEKVLDIYRKSSKRAGYRFITAILRLQYKMIVNHKKVLRIMQELGIQSIIRRKHKVKREKHYSFNNELNRDFQSNKPGEKYATDITYIPTKHTTVYLCTVIDLFNNEPVAWNISDTADKNLSIDTIKQLAKIRNLKGSLIHSDQGMHYTTNGYVDLLKELGVTQSMSRKGNCWDNAKAESFFSHYKTESIKLMKKKLKTIWDVIEVTTEYMDYYINYRPQKKLNGMSPNSYKLNYMEQ